MSSRYRDWDEASRHSDPRTSYSTITRYVIADDRSSAPSRREDYPSSSSDRQQVAIRTLDREERDTMPRRYEYEYNLDTDFDRGFPFLHTSYTRLLCPSATLHILPPLNHSC